MKNYMQGWKAFCSEKKYDKLVESRANRSINEEGPILTEISQDELDRIKQQISIFSDKISPQKELNFSNIFGDKLRIVEPFEAASQEELEKTPLGRILGIFKITNSKADFTNGTVTTEVEVVNRNTGETQTRPRTMKIGKFLGKLASDLSKIKKAEKEVDDIPSSIDRLADLAFGRKEHPADTKFRGLRKKFQRDFNTQETYNHPFFQDVGELIDFWNKKSAFYRENPEEAKISNPYSIVYSRAPIDVLRMSDFQNIQSCHSPGHEYFHCAKQEVKNGGFIAFVIKTEDLKDLEEMGIDLQDPEVFLDDKRLQDGIEPVSRVRIRRFQYESPFDNETRYMAAAEQRTYGKRFPGFVEKVEDWLRSVQPEVQKMVDSKGRFADWDTIVRVGGSYGDTHDDEVLDSLLDPEGKWEPYDGLGNAESDSGDEDEFQSRAQEYEQAAEEAIRSAENQLEHVSLYAEVEDYGDGAYISFHGDIGWEFESEEAGDLSIQALNDWSDQNMRAVRRNLESEIEDALEKAGIYDVDTGDVNIHEYNGGDTISLGVMINTGDYAPTPEGLDDFLEMLKQYDQKWVQAKVHIRQVLQSYGILQPGEYVNLQTKLDDLGDEAYEHFEVDLESDWIHIEPREPVTYQFDEFIRPFAQVISKNPAHDISDIPRSRVRKGRLENPGGYFADLAVMDIRSALSTPDFKRTVIEQIKAGSLRYLKNQLNLPGFDTQKEIEDLIAPAGWILDVVVDGNGEAEFKIKVVIDPDDEDEEILIAQKFIEWLDGNYYKIKKAIEVTATKALQKRLEQMVDKSDSFSTGQNNLSEAQKVQIQIEKARELVQEIEPYQKEMRRKHPKWKKRLIGMGDNKYKGGPYKIKVSMKRSKSAPPGAGGS